MSIFSTFKVGQDYMNTWPLIPRLGMIFPENRVIKTTRFAQKFMPFIAVFAILWQHWYTEGDTQMSAVAVLTAVFALCIPLQGLYWLGKRANTGLSAQSAAQFYRICKRLEQAGATVPNVVEKPEYRHLAIILKQAEIHLPADFWQEI